MTENNPTLLEALKQVLHHRKSNQYFADKLGCSIEEIEWAREALKKQGYVACKMTKETLTADAEAAAGNYIAELEEQVVKRFEEDIKAGTAEATFSLKDEIHNLDELIEKCKIDTTKWEITKYVQNYWGNIDCPRWQVKAWLSAKKVQKEDVIARVIENYVSTYVPFTKEQLHINNRFDRPSMAYIALTDAHIDKRTVDGQSIEYKISLYKKVLELLTLKAYYSHKLEEIVYTIGHDMFNTDGYHEKTTNDTQQFNNTEWDDAYDKGFDLQVWSINFLKQFCNTLHVKYVPSNHARTKEYYLVHALETYFKADPSIKFDRSSESTKVHLFGECFLGMHHGDTKLESLPLYFAQKYYKEWGQAKFKEIGVGDKHHKETLKLKANIQKEDIEIDGVRVFMTPSMGGLGRWDKYKLFDNAIQSGICRVYDFEKGKVTEFEERI